MYPKHPIADMSKLSESELFTIYFDPMLSVIFSDNERNFLLRWINRQVEDKLVRPDAVITSNLGFGEVKINQPCDNAAICHDFLRLTHLTKENIDRQLLEGSLGFQIHGFCSVHLAQLSYTQIYTMTELGKVQFPKSQQDISSFCCYKNLNLLAKITQAFWLHCKPTHPPQP